MTQRYYSSIAQPMSLSASIADSALTIVLDAVAGLPSSVPFTLVLEPGSVAEEIVTVTAIAGFTLTVVRGEDGTAAQAHLGGAEVRHMMTARDLREPQQHIEASVAVHGLASGVSVVGTTTAQTLTNKVISGAANTITNLPTASHADASITAAKLASNAVTTAKVLDANITTAKIADVNVTTGKLADNAVTTAKITDANITTAKLADSSVTVAKMADASVGTAELIDANVTTAKLADGAVTRAKWASDLPKGVVGTDILSASSTTQQASGGVGQNFVHPNATLNLTAGTWLVDGGASVYTSDAADTVAAGLYDQTLAAVVASSLGEAGYVEATGPRRPLRTMPTVITVATTKDVRLYLDPNGSSTVGAGGSHATAPAVWLFARRL